MNRNKLVLALSLVGFGSLSVYAEAPVSFNVGGGFTTPAYNTGIRHNTGWNGSVGVGITPFSHVGLRGEFQYNQLAINGSTLSALSFPNGDTRLWSLTLNPILRLHPRGMISPYLIGGGGLYHRTAEFTAPTVATVTAYDPYFNYFYRVAVPANQVLASQSVMKGGVNGGAGFTVRFGESRTSLYFEARYHHMFTRPVATTLLPVTVGLRW
jgi:opacity protein-like surface antigen